ncbi:hypothetical protein GPALN_005424 [Globodera pallida]|nr:hypothetical protein GPALN_005424 [Globodera pallida]
MRLILNNAFPPAAHRPFFFLFGCFCLLFSVISESGHHRRLLIRTDRFYFIVRTALTECAVPHDCVFGVEKALLNCTQVPQCNASDYFELLKCLDLIILTRTNLTELNSRAGRVCCEIEEVSLPCRLACRSALFAPTLSHHQKQKRIEMVCHRGHGNEIRGDRGVLNCLQTTRQWLPQRHKLNY